MPILTYSTTPTNVLQLFAKRAIDVVVSVSLLVIALPVILAIAAAIKVSSGGAVLFRQTRCGLNGRIFTLYKFRTMVEGAEERRRELQHLNEMNGPVFKVRADPRVTVFGRFLRKFSLDELPQLWNVLRGDMSLVGPRPPIPEEVAQYQRWQRRRLSMKPGLTCLWQISGRNELDFDRWMELDLEYIDSWSPMLDLKILVKTIPVVLSGRGAS
jgi:exopolysaccharide biosynthesis polyprenyl glycosylphosphotransferase